MRNYIYMSTHTNTWRDYSTQVIWLKIPNQTLSKIYITNVSLNAGQSRNGFLAVTTSALVFHVYLYQSTSDPQKLNAKVLTILLSNVLQCTVVP